MPLPIHRCPPEVLMAFVEASEHVDRCTLRTLNKTWRSLATSFVFESLVLEPSKESTKKILALIRHRLARWAKRLEYRVDDETDYLSIPDPSRWLARPGTDPAFSAAMIILSKMPNCFPLLEKFCVRLFSGRFIAPMHFPKSAEEVEQGVPKPIVQHIQILEALNTVGEAPPPRIRTLELHNILPMPDASLLEEGFKNLMECLESLTISVHRNRSLDNSEFWETFWAGYLPDYILAPTQPRLTSLTLVSDQPVGAELPGIDLSALHFPRLQHLKLGGFCFDMSDCLESFIVNHGPTLTSLVLDSCPLWTGNNFQNKMPKRKWSQIFARFEEHLTHLTYLRVMCKFARLWGLNTEDSLRTELELTYETSTSGYGYDRGEPVAATVEHNDRKTLENFYATVDERRKPLGLTPLDRGQVDPNRLVEQLPQIMDLLVSSLLF